MRVVSERFLHVVSFLALLVYLFTYLENCFGPPIRADGVGYYAYLPAFLIDRDASFVSLADRQFGGELESWTGLRLIPDTGRYLDKFNMGVAVMMLPFFLVAHAATWWMQSPAGGFAWWKFNHPMDGFSLFYQHAAGLAGLVYMILGLAILARVLRRHFTDGVVVATLTVLVFGTNLLHYTAGETVLSHAYSFFLFALLLAVIPGWYENPSFRARTVLLGLLAGLTALVRLPNALILLFIPFHGVTGFKGMRDRFLLLRRRWVDCAMLLGVALLVYFPQMWLHRYATGRWIADAYSIHGEGFRFLHPQLLEVLISPEGGLFFWSPVLLLALPGLLLLRRQASALFLPSMLFLLLNTYLIASWHMWWFGGGFGHRAFIEGYTVMAFGLCATFTAVRAPVLRIILGVLVLVLVCYSLFMMKLFYTREISYYGVDSQALFDVLWIRKELLLSILRRLMGCA